MVWVRTEGVRQGLLKGVPKASRAEAEGVSSTAAETTNTLEKGDGSGDRSSQARKVGHGGSMMAETAEIAEIGQSESKTTDKRAESIHGESTQAESPGIG